MPRSPVALLVSQHLCPCEVLAVNTVCPLHVLTPFLLNFDSSSSPLEALPETLYILKHMSACPSILLNFLMLPLPVTVQRPTYLKPTYVHLCMKCDTFDA